MENNRSIENYPMCGMLSTKPVKRKKVRRETRIIRNEIENFFRPNSETFHYQENLNTQDQKLFVFT